MSKKHSGVNYSKAAMKQIRRKAAHDRLTIQLADGTKHSDGIITPLTEKDITRIKKEQVIIKSRL